MALVPPIPLSDFSGGNNAFEKEVQENQALESENVWERNGYVERRPTLKPILTGPAYLLPIGAVYVKHEYPLNTFSTSTHLNPSVAASARIGGSTGRLWVGCREPFDGIDIQVLSSTFTSLTDSKKVVIRYRKTDLSLGVAYGVVDTTARQGSLTTENDFIAPLQQPGRISWHRDQFTAWTATTLNSQSAYWIAIDVGDNEATYGETEPPVSSLTGSGTWTVGLPGIRTFVLSPINGLWAGKTFNRNPTIVVAADVTKRDWEPGANLGYVKNEKSVIETPILVEYDLAMVADEVVKPAWSHAGASTGLIGTEGYFTKTDPTFSFRVDQFNSGKLFTFDITGLTYVGGSPALTIDRPSIPDEYSLENCIVYNEDDQTYAEIFADGPSNLYLWEKLISWANGDTCHIFTPTYVRTRLGKLLYPILDTTTTTILVPKTSTLYTVVTDRASVDKDAFVHAEIGALLPHKLPRGKEWHFMFNPVTGRVLMTNGASGILEYDGVRTRRLTTLWDNTDGVEGAATVELWTGNLAELALELGDPQINNGSKLRRSPPDAKLMTFYRGHVVVVPNEEPTTIQWTAPNAVNNIWPYVYSTKVRDVESTPITGLHALNEQLVATSASSIFAANPPGADSYLVFNPVAQGAGFINAKGVVNVNLAGNGVLLGPNVDGIYAFTGASMLAVLDSWDRIIPDGVNPRLLYKSVGAVWQSENIYFLAVPSAGSSYNDKIIVCDYSTFPEPKFYVWSAPFGGITSIARDFDDTGAERILFGTKDGHVCTLADGSADGGEVISWRAKSPPVSFPGMTFAATQLRLLLEEMGSTATITVKTFLNTGAAKQTITRTVVGPGATFDGTVEWGADAQAGNWADKVLKGITLHLRAGGVNSSSASVSATKGELFQYELSGTAPFKLREAALVVDPKGVPQK